ncbi:DMSO/selenate family reductase complex B subunit [Shewanella intestini]|uniref:Dimethylsulfoxide reductase subunit B n=1 Tax=Shewanella intestini TaxID=2017544 RepID=A0ABS5I2T2_9GAMM|nr:MULTISPECIES: DMSO/selenate family reductase complex B subunit [Shewanella]MBR9727655.1 dimethylsulfoxide reductase subunit B [Shewanella intestini]MRG35195.1 dimethylsulfoxide reductase subunit B [Shewanella sp. XMDDZSB0408]
MTAKTATIPTKQYGFYIDTTVCSGCKTCMVSCKDRSNVNAGLKWRRVYEMVGGSWNKQADGSFQQDVFSYYTSIGCNHCSDPACVKVCPVGAHTKRESDGFVLIDADKCIGCQACASQCPYDAPQFDANTHKMTKCDGCNDRVAKGLMPQCVESCPSRALDFGEIGELRKKYGKNADIQSLPDSSQTKPNIIVKVNKHGTKSGHINNAFEVTNPALNSSPRHVVK